MCIRDSRSTVATIILNWNGRPYLEACLSALMAQTYPIARVMLVDNDSSDDSLPFVRQAFPTVEVIANGGNVGFAAGNNVALRALMAETGERTADVALLLNPDVVLSPTYVAALAATLAADPTIAVVGGKLWYPDGATLQMCIRDSNEYGDGKIALGTDPALAKLSAQGNASLCPAPGAPDTDANDPRLDVYCRSEHDSVRIFIEQVKGMREWMKAHGQQNKPLIISEFGLLYAYVRDDNGQYYVQDEHGQPFAPARVTEYLRDTIAYLENAKDANLGYPADSNRLVQQWLWYSIVTDPESSGGSSNLINWDTFQTAAPGDPAALTMICLLYTSRCV